MKKIILLAGVLAVAACSDSKTTVRVLKEQGYTGIQTQGYALFSCGRDDTFATAFTATSPNGTRVSGAVCSGWFKGATIRFD